MTTADTVERNSSKGEKGSYIKKESERITVIPVNGVLSETRTLDMETRSCGDETTGGLQVDKQSHHNVVNVNLEDVDENDLD